MLTTDQAAILRAGGLLRAYHESDIDTVKAILATDQGRDGEALKTFVAVLAYAAVAVTQLEHLTGEEFNAIVDERFVPALASAAGEPSTCPDKPID